MSRASCRSCGSADLTVFLSLGNLPLANGLVERQDLDQPEERFPLDVAICPSCSLVQLTESVPPDKMFRHYRYFSSFSDTMVEHARGLAERMVSSRRLGAGSRVVELGSNDGYLLRHFQERGVPVLGIEPARNVAEEALRRGIPTLCEYFGESLARRLREEGKSANAIAALNVLAHVPDLNGFVAGIAILLESSGVAVIEVPYVKDLMDRCEYDTIYHEHLCYFSITALQELFRRHGMRLADVERLGVHGGSLRLWVEKGSAGPGPEARRLLEEEKAWGVRGKEVYDLFARRVEGSRESFRATLAELRRRGARIAGYGAAAKATVLLNYCGIGPDTVEYVADRSPHKQGRFVPGVRIPIVPPQRVFEERPDYLVIFPWNIGEEIMRQMRPYAEKGGRFILPIPAPKLV